MPLSKEEFARQWIEAGEEQTPLIVDTAWRRYQQVHSSNYKIVPESSEPSLDDLRSAFESVLTHPDVSPYVMSYKFLTIHANAMPWQATDIYVGEDQPVSVFPTGRTWRSRLLDLYLPPQFNLWYKIGVSGEVFNSTRETRTFKCIPEQYGELYLSVQFPGQFGSRTGGRVQGNLTVYENAQGAYQTLIIQWREGLGIRGDMHSIFEMMESITRDAGNPDPYGLISTAKARVSSDYFAHHFPIGWTLLWFLGVSEIFTQEEDKGSAEEPSQFPHDEKNDLLVPVSDENVEPVTPGSEFLIQTRSQAPPPIIRCLPYHNTGILQHDLSPIQPFTPTTEVTWAWKILSLPSRLREDTNMTHDYLSLAFEFENGRDLSYYWSWELPVDDGYWCPVATFRDREYHIVIRSGTEGLGKWFSEKRNMWTDYVRYINEGDEKRVVPTQIVRVWLIAGNRWQRYRGEMLIKNIILRDPGIEGDENRVIL